MDIAEALKPLIVPISSIRADPRNARIHNERNINTIKKSLETYGQRKPIVVNHDGIIEAGNGLYQAAKELGWTEIAVVKVKDDGDHAKGYALMDNQSALLADWSLPDLKDLLEELDTGAFDMDATGFLGNEIEDLMTQFHIPKEGLTDDDAIPGDVETVCKTGDLWRLGSHRLLCGDATKREDVERLMGGEKADMVFTDPPYGINLDTDFSQMKSKLQFVKEKHLKSKTGNKYKPVEGDDVDYDPTWLLGLFQYCREVFLWGGDYYLRRLPLGGSLFVWDKRVGEQFDKMYGSVFEVCWSKAKHRREIIRHVWAGVFGTEQEDIRGRLHPTQKPIAVCEWFINRFSKMNEIIVDIYGGSGSTLIACEKLDRKCYMMEILPRYCDIIIERWQQFTGKQAEKING